MIPYVRQNKIYNFVKMKRIVYLQDLVDMTGVSLPTVRRDLKKLSEEGRIELLSGGGVKVCETDETAVQNRIEAHADQKYLIASRMVNCIRPGDFIYLGPGTTENFLISHLAAKDITVVTNGIFHASKLLEYGIKTIIIGGQMENRFGITLGSEVVKEIGSMHFDKCIIGCSGITDTEVTTFDHEVSTINATALKCSTESYLIVDESKFGTKSRFRFAEPEEFKAIITSGKIADAYRQMKNIIMVSEHDISSDVRSI